MKIKRIFAQDMRQAIKRVRDEHGPDAVILSSKTVTGGVEVISAIDFDQAAVEAALVSERQARREAVDRPRGRADFTSTPESRRSFGDALKQAQQPGGEPPAQRQRIDVAVDDALEDDLERAIAGAFTFPEKASKAVPKKPEADKQKAKPKSKSKSRSSLADVEWTQEPAIREMRSEIKTLRSLFENQLSVLDWQQRGQRHPERTLLLRQLTEMGFGPDVCRKLADRVTEGVRPEIALRQALAMVTRHLPVTGDDIVERGGIIAVVGPTGVGKTTTVAKLAARFALRHGRQHVALVSTDNYRIGAQDQLRNFGRILGVPVQTAASAAELGKVLEDLRDKRLVLLDTAGMSQRDVRLAEQFNALRHQKAAIRSYLVVSATTQLSSLNETAKTFKRVGLAGCVITKTDEATSLGGVLTMLLRQRLPAAYLGPGQRVPEDLLPARSDKLVQEALALVEHHRQTVDDDELALAFGGQQMPSAPV
ncbi:MAG: flagellar biosynthesis protein FlhF [Ectothiorhodospiraceae bacterium]|nr:flagellar biosynthesis protein FlhF [Ectothiorhodospiraceae bacterium]